MRYVGLLWAAATLLSAQPAVTPPNLMPWPAQVEMGQGRLVIGPTIRIAITGYSEPRLERAVRRLGELVRNPSQAALVIACDHASAPVQQIAEDESYRLLITAQQAHLNAPNPLGVLHGLATFRQLSVSTANGFEAPVIEIQDRPRFPWRGLHLDVSRHWMPIGVVKRNLDGMAAV